MRDGVKAGIAQLRVAFWVVTIAVIGFWVTGLVMGAFNPLEMWLFTGVVLAMLGLFVMHEVRVVRVLRDEEAPGHEELRQTLNRQRETRGF